MKSLIFSVLLFVCFSVSQAQQTILYAKNAIKREVVASFKAIDVSGGVDLYLSPSEEEALAVSADDDKSRDEIVTRVENGVLRIYAPHTSWKITRALKNRTAYVSCKQLEAITASGSSDVRIFGSLKGEDVKIRLAGASDFKGTVDVKRLMLDQAGASDAVVTGRTAEFVVNVSGASKASAYELQTDECKAVASGASEVKVTVNKELSATASGASSIYYKGDPSVKDSRTSGASSIGKKG